MEDPGNVFRCISYSQKFKVDSTRKMKRIWGSEAAKTITNGIVVLIVVMKKMSSNEMDTELVSVTWDFFSNDFWSVSRSARALGDQTANNCFRRSRGELANGLMATWPERFTELHQSSCPNSSPLRRSAQPHGLGSARTWPTSVFQLNRYASVV